MESRKKLEQLFISGLRKHGRMPLAGLGEFQIERISSQLDEFEGMANPPKGKINFKENKEATQDFFVEYLMEAEDWAEYKSKKEAEHFFGKIQEELDNINNARINELGNLEYVDGTVKFTPRGNENLLDDTFGMPPVFLPGHKRAAKPKAKGQKKRRRFFFLLWLLPLLVLLFLLGCYLNQAGSFSNFSFTKTQVLYAFDPVESGGNSNINGGSDSESGSKDQNSSTSTTSDSGLSNGEKEKASGQNSDNEGLNDGGENSSSGTDNNINQTNIDADNGGSSHRGYRRPKYNYPSGHYVIVGSFTSPKEASNVRKLLKEEASNVYLVPGPGGRTRVGFHIKEGKEKAEASIDYYRKIVKHDAWVTYLP